VEIKREDVYVANILKKSEDAKTAASLKERILAIKPKVVVALGSTATAILTQSKTGISALRGRFHPLPWDKNIFVMPTFHPAYLLKNPAAKSLVWEDMKIILNKLKTL
jgi:DNA polymerase